MQDLSFESHTENSSELDNQPNVGVGISPHELIAKALQSYLNKNYKTALEQFSALHNNPIAGSLNTSFFLGNCHFQLGHLEKAEACWKEALTKTPNSSKILTNLGNLYYSQKQVEKAILTWYQAMTVTPESETLNYNLATSYSQKGFRDLAIYYYEKFIKYASNKEDQNYLHIVEAINNYRVNSTEYLDSAKAFLEMRNFKQAVTCYMASLSIYPLQPEVSNHLSKIFYKFNNYAKSVEYALKAFRTDPSKRLGVLNAAIGMYKMEMYNYAYCFFKRALEQTGGRNEKYFFILKQIEEVTPKLVFTENAVNSHYENAKAYDQEGNFQKALEEYENFLFITDTPNEEVSSSIERIKLFLDPEPPVISHLMRQIDIAIIQTQNDEAIAMCNRLTKLTPDNSREYAHAKKKKLEATARKNNNEVQYDKIIEEL